MRFSVLASGSSGNATYVESDDGGLLVDAGVSRRRLSVLLGSIGRSMSDVRAVLLTHGHSDHTCGLRHLPHGSGVEVFSGPGVGEKFGATILGPDEPFAACGLTASFFSVPHDAPTFGIRLTDGDSSLAYATDFGVVSEGIFGAMSGADAVVLEANHDYEWLMRGPYPARLKRRIASDDGHLSNEQAAEFALMLCGHGLKEVVLGHLSKTNNSPARATGVVSHVLRRAGHGGVRVRAAIADRPTPWVEVGRELDEWRGFAEDERPTGTDTLFGA